MLAPVGVGEAEVQQRAHVRHRPVACPFGYHPPKDLPERLFAGGVEREVVQPAAPEHRPGARRLDAGHLEGVQHRVRSHLDEGVPQVLLLQVDRHPRPEDAFVEGDQPVHVGRDERQVVNAVQQPQLRLLLSLSPEERDGGSSPRGDRRRNPAPVRLLRVSPQRV